MTDELFEGAIVEGKKFPFIRITPNSQKRILKRFRTTLIDALCTKFLPSGITERDWKRIRKIAFEKSFTWRWLKIVPKELRCNRITLKQSGEIQASFFELFKDAQAGYSKPLNSVLPLEIKKEPKS